MALDLKNLGGGGGFKIEVTELPKASPGTDEPPTVCLYGNSGTGKTRLIAQLLLRGEVVYMLHFGRGRTGTMTIRSLLYNALGMEKGKALMESNFRQIRITETAQVVKLCETGWDALKDTVDDPDFLDRVTFLAFEEINTLQSRYEYNLTPKKDGIPRITGTRKKDDDGQSGSFGHFGDLKMGTEWVVEKLLLVHPPDRLVGHVWTFHEGIVKQMDESGITGPAIQTKAVLGIMGAFDFLIQLKLSRAVLGSEDKYTFELRSAKALTKVRGENWPASMEAQPAELWEAIMGERDPATLGGGNATAKPATTTPSSTAKKIALR